jgi:putative ABC transport system ATP-binding protein
LHLSVADGPNIELGIFPMTGSMPLIRIENVTRVFEDGGVVALRGVSLSIHAEDCVAILGKSGSGKSSLIHIMGGCDSPTSGKVYWRGEPVSDQQRWRLLRATEIGIIFQEFHLLPALTAIENVEMALMGKGVSSNERRRRSAQLLERVGLAARMDHLPGALSGGERQRVAIARSIANNPSLLLADEPTGNLDSANAAMILDLLLDIQQTHGTALVLVTHDESLAARCLRRVTIKDGLIMDDRLTPKASDFENMVAEDMIANSACLTPHFESSASAE